MKPTYFSGVETEDTEEKDLEEEMTDEIRLSAYDINYVDMDLFITIDKASLVTMKEFLESCGIKPERDYGDNIIVSDIPRNREQLSELARSINRFLSLQTIKDADIIIKEHNGEAFYDVCITPKCPFDADYFVNSICAKFTDLRYKTIGITLNKDLLRIILEKGQIVSQGPGTTNSKWKEDLDKLFQKGNWYCSKYYGPMAMRLKHSTLPYQVVVYECLPYIREDDNYLIETQIPLNDPSVDLNSYSEDTDILVFSCFNPINPSATSWTSHASMKFHGVYRLDKGKSKMENFISFHLIKDIVEVRVCSSHR